MTTLWCIPFEPGTSFCIFAPECSGFEPVVAGLTFPF